MKNPALIVAAALAVPVLSGLGWAWKYYTAEVRGVSEAERRIESADSRIGNYEHFYDLCAFVQSQEVSLSSQRSLLESSEDAKERTRVRSNIAGLEAQRARAINQYNADANKSYTRARFLGEDLPRKLDANVEATSC